MQILVDANALFHKSYAISKKYAEPISTQKGQEQLFHRAATDLISYLKLFPGEHEIYWLMDGPSWRKGKFGTVPTGIDLDPESHQALYKNNRKQMSNNFYNVFNIFSSALEEIGVTVAKIDGLEADDLAMLFTTNARKESRSSISLTVDHDWDQLVSSDDSSFIGVYNHHSSNKNLYLDQPQLGFKVKQKIIDPKRFIVEKIFSGDGSDNIPSIFDNGKRGGRVTGKKLEMLTDWFFESGYGPNDLINPAVHSQIQSQLQAIFKKDPAESFDNVPDMILANMVFMYLVPDFLPEHLVQEWIDDYSEQNSAIYTHKALNEQIRPLAAKLL